MTAIATLPVLLGTGIHASRPAAGDVGSGGLYSCTTHNLVYQTDGSSWTTWASLGSGGPLHDFSTLSSNTGISSSSWGAVATGTDNSVAAVTGDLIEVGLWCRIESGGNQFFQDAYTMVSASPVNSVGLGTAAPSGTSGVGVLPWVGDASNSYHPAGRVWYVAQSGDLSGGTITVRWYARCPSGTGTISGGSRFDLINWGQ